MLQVWNEPVFWFVLRMVQGACLAGLFTVADSWINERTPNTVRGQVLGIYFIVITCALVGGQLLLYFFDATSAVLVMIVSGLFSVALIPVALTSSTSPEPPEVVTVNPWRLYQRMPAAVFGCFVVGAMGAAVLNMSPYFLTSAAVPTAQIGLFMGTIHVTRLVLQWPVGLLSDRLDRRVVIVASSVLIVVLAAVFAIMAPGGGQLFHDPSLEMRKLIAFGLFGLLGAFSMMLYSVCIAHAHDRGTSEESVAITSTLLLVWSVGAMVGLLVLGVLIEIVGGNVIFLFTGGMAAVLAVHTGWRMIYREAPEQTGRFKEVPVTSPVISMLEPAPEEHGHEDE
jgi:MFS family permease